LVEAGLAAAGVRADQVDVLASAELKAREEAVLALAAARGWRLMFFTADALAGVTVPTPSAVVARHVGTASVAEASALLAARAGARLALRKQRSAHATVAVAMGGAAPASKLGVLAATARRAAAPLHDLRAEAAR
jgi:cobalamin biosynthesis protein CbiG